MLKASPIVFYRKPETGFPWKNKKSDLGQEGRSFYSRFFWRSKFSFWKVFLEGLEIILKGFALEKHSGALHMSGGK
jgi:hypothetical protein